VGLGRLETGIVGVNPAQGMNVCPHLLALSCVNRGFATRRHLAQGVLQTAEEKGFKASASEAA
jgi:hypothetical protein